jgi:hypothetical protein
MDFKFLKINNIFIDKNNFLKYKNVNGENKKLEIVTPVLYLPFGIDKDKKNNLQFNLQLRRSHCMKHNHELKLFLIFFQSIEKIISDHFKTSIKSNIKINEQYDPILQTKIYQSNNQILTEILKDKDNYNVYKIKKGEKMRCIIMIDKLWLFQNTVFYKIKLKKIFVKSV